MLNDANGRMLVLVVDQFTSYVLNNIDCIAGRIKDVQQRRILDESARKRRQRKALEALEDDNFQEDPHADLKMNKRAPKFEESVEACM